MLTINLLPQKEKRQIAMERNRRFTIFVGISTFVVLLVFAALLFSTKLYVDIQLEPLRKEIQKEQERSDIQEAKRIENEIQSTTKLVTRFKDIQGAVSPWTPVLLEISRLVSDGITFSSLDVSDAEGGRHVTIIGHADDRDRAFIGFENSIKENPLFSDLDSPNTNRIREENIDFIVRFRVRN